jgi:hypothetical protein
VILGDGRAQVNVESVQAVHSGGLGISKIGSDALAGGLFHYKDGRDFPDLIETFYDYPNFCVALRCNLNNDHGESLASTEPRTH